MICRCCGKVWEFEEEKLKEGIGERKLKGFYG